MSDQLGSMPEVAEAVVASAKSRRLRFSLVWVVPLVAALIGGWLVVKALTERGPQITITFKSAEGLEAGKTKVKFKDVEVGLVEEIRIAKDASHVELKVQMVKEAARFISEHTRFWVVRARVSASAIYGLGTVFSGAYIDIDPGKPGKPVYRFTGLEEPPIVTTGLPGRHFILESDRRGSIEVGAPIYFRQIRVGEVVAYSLSESGTKIVSKIFVHAPYHEFVKQNTRFWVASGVNIRLNAQGIQVDTESLVSILVGGIGFDGFGNNSDPEQPAAENATFKLYANRELAQEKIYSTKNHFVMLFEESVRGLSPGAPVEFRGIQIGQVIDVKSEFDFKMNKVKIPVIAAVEPERISFIGKLPEGVSRESLVDYMVEKGLRAQLRTGNLLTGQNYVALDFFPNAKPAALVRGGRYGHTEFPTTPTQLEEIGTKVSQLVAKLDRLPLDQIGSDLAAAIKGAKRITNSPEIIQAVKSLNAAVQELQLLTAELRTRTAPELQATLQQAQASLSAAGDALASSSPLQMRLKEAMEEVAAAARAFRALSDSLERQPQSLITGKEPSP
jgi:paraquat-inducible protein B